MYCYICISLSLLTRCHAMHGGHRGWAASYARPALRGAVHCAKSVTPLSCASVPARSSSACAASPRCTALLQFGTTFGTYALATRLVRPHPPFMPTLATCPGAVMPQRKAPVACSKHCPATTNSDLSPDPLGLCTLQASSTPAGILNHWVAWLVSVCSYALWPLAAGCCL